MHHHRGPLTARGRLKTKSALLLAGLALMFLVEVWYSLAVAPYALPGEPAGFPNGPVTAACRGIASLIAPS